jgi:hypothetical protein
MRTSEMVVAAVRWSVHCALMRNVGFFVLLLLRVKGAMVGCREVYLGGTWQWFPARLLKRQQTCISPSIW